MAKRAAKRKGSTIEIVQVRSGICAPENHKRTLRALGFRRLNQKVVRPDNPAIRGMVATIPYLVRVVGE
jgi:large subunit ribosomal protein L30